MNDRKIGWMSYIQEDEPGTDGKHIRLTADSTMTIELMGTAVSQDTKVVSICDSKLHPIVQDYTISSNGSTVRLHAAYSNRQVEVTLDTGGTPSKRVLTVPADGTLGADSSFLSLGAEPRVGTKQVVYYLNPVTITLDRSVVTVEAREKVRYAGKEHEAVRMLAVTPLGKMRTWEDPPGRVLWGEMPLGMAMYLMSREDALNPDVPVPDHAAVTSQGNADLSPPEDFARATAVIADKPIGNPRKLRSLTLEISGVPSPKLVISDFRQQVSPVAGRPGAYRYRIVASSGSAPDRKMPIKDAALLPYVQKAPYLDTDNAEIRQLARNLRDPASARRTASRIRAWINKNLMPDYSIGVPRSATDVLQRRRGVCRDYAVLFAAIARAAGVPTRLVGGMVYAEGKFFYHAWVECWTGAWVPFDATLPTDFVDATHVKFAQGDPTDMMRVYEVVGKLTVRIIGTGY
jgi:hypothetical protein